MTIVYGIFAFLLAYEYPFYAVQWHPEVNAYEFYWKGHGNRGVPHTFDAVKVTQYFANFFVEEARKSRHKFDNSEEEEMYMIYKYHTYHASVRAGWGFEQIYIFD